MDYDFREILDIGLEIEFSNIKRETPNFVNNLHKELVNFRHVHDASTETPEITLGNIPVQFDVDGKSNKILSIMRTRNFEIFGGELNSPILGSDDFRTHIYKLMDFLIDMGESFSTTEQDNRGSIHVHVNVSKDIKHRHLIRLLELGLATEAIFYRLGGMGRVNRGVRNSFVYQRPLTMPPCISVNNRIYPIFDYKDLLASKNKTDFYYKYGDTVSQIQHNNHYVTQRYMGLNFYSIPYRGSIEFRYANKVLIPEWIIAWITLCQCFANFALTKPKDNDFETVYRKLEDNRDIPEDEVTFILDRLGVPADNQITLLDIWHNSALPEFNGRHLITHLPNPTFFSRDGYLPNTVEKAERISVEDVRTVNQVKNIKLHSSSESFGSEVDYIIDTSGVKTKLKDIGRPEENLFNNMHDVILRNWQMAGLDLTRPNTQENVIDFVQARLLRGKIIPFDCLITGHRYEFNTVYDNLLLIFTLRDNKRIIEFYFYDEVNGEESRIIETATLNNETFGCKAFSFQEYIGDCHDNPDNYFGDDDNHEDINIFDDDNPDMELDEEGNVIEFPERNPEQRENGQNGLQELIDRLNNVGNAARNVVNVVRNINIQNNGEQ